MSEQAWRTINEVMLRCKGWVESILLTINDGRPLAYTNILSLQECGNPAEIVSVLERASQTLQLLGLKGFESIDIQLRDKRHLLVRPYQGYFIICLTIPEPNMGLVNKAIEEALERSLREDISMITASIEKLRESGEEASRKIRELSEENIRLSRELDLAYREIDILRSQGILLIAIAFTALAIAVVEIPLIVRSMEKKSGVRSEAS